MSELHIPSPSAPPMPPPWRALDTRYPLGPLIRDLAQQGRVLDAIEIGPASILTRPEPFHAEPVDPALSPCAPDFTEPARRRHANGPLHLVCLGNPVLIGRGALLLHEGRILREGLGSSDGWRPDSLIANGDEAGAIRLKRSPGVPRPLAGHHMLGFVGAWRNHAHWLTECLPRLTAYRFALLPRGVRLLLPKLPPDGPQAASLRLLQIPPEMIETVDEDDVLALARLWAVTSFGVWHPPPLCRAAALLLSMAVPLSEAEAAGELPDRLYIRRDTDTRRLLNYESLKPVLARHGFRVAVLQGFPLDQQIRLLRNARLVIGENSGGLANVMFARSGLRLLELNNPAFPHPAHWALAGLCGLDYGYSIGTHVPKWANEPPTMNSNYAIDPGRFAAAVEALVAPTSGRPAPQSTARAG